MCEGKQVFLETDFNLATALKKCAKHIELLITLPTCGPISWLPSDQSTMVMHNMIILSILMIPRSV